VIEVGAGTMSTSAYIEAKSLERRRICCARYDVIDPNKNGHSFAPASTLPQLEGQSLQIIMTFEETMAKLCVVWRSCRAPPRRVQRAVAGQGCFLAASVLDHLGDEVTMTIENEFQKSDRLERRQRRSTDCYPPDRPR